LPRITLPVAESLNRRFAVLRVLSRIFMVLIEPVLSKVGILAGRAKKPLFLGFCGVLYGFFGRGRRRRKAFGNGLVGAFRCEDDRHHLAF
jgi:hypothetical protein